MKKLYSIILLLGLGILTGNTAIQTYFDGVTITNSTYYGNGHGLTNLNVANVTGIGTAAYSNASAFYLNSNPSNYATTAVTNGLATTNYVNTATNGFVGSSITNGLATTNYVLTQISSTNAANLTTTTNLVVAATNNFTSLVYTNPSSILYTSSLPGLTNGFVMSSITNGLATTNYVNTATNGFVDSSITNGLSTTNFVLNQISFTNAANLTTTTNLVVASTNNFTTLVYTNPSAILYTSSLPALTNGFVTISITNGLASTNFAMSVTNNFTTLVYTNPSSILYTSSLPTLTNGFVGSSITNGLATTNYVNTATNGFVGSSITNGLATTNYVNTATNGFVGSSITNGLATTNYVNTATNGFVGSNITNGLATTNYVLTQISSTNSANLTTTTNLVAASTNNFTTLVYTNPLVILYTNSLPGLTNGFVGSNITNGLATTNYVLTQISATNAANLMTTTNLVVAATNNFTTLVYTNPSSILYTSSLPALTNGFVTSSITNGLATTNYVNTSISATNAANLTTTTNLVVAATNNFTTIVYSNASAYRLVGDTNFPGIYVTNIVNVNGTGRFLSNLYLAQNLYITNHAYDSSTNLLDPEANEYVTATFVRNVLNNGAFLYGTTNTTSVGFSNILNNSTNTISLQFGDNPPNGYVKGFTNFASGTYINGPYFASIISTNTYQSVNGPFVNDLYVVAGGASPEISITPDIFVTYNRTNLIPICQGAGQALIANGTTNLYTWIQSASQYNSTNSAGFYVVRRVRVVSQGGNNLYINVYGGNGYATSLSFNTPVAVNANYSGTFTGNGAGLTNIAATNIIGLNVTSGGTNFPGIYVTNNAIVKGTIYASNASVTTRASLNANGITLDKSDDTFSLSVSPYSMLFHSDAGYDSLFVDNTQSIYDEGYMFTHGRFGIATVSPSYPLDVFTEGVSGQFGAYPTIARFGGGGQANIFVDATANPVNAASIVLASWNLNDPSGPYGYYMGTENNGNFRISQMPSVDQDGYTAAKDFGVPGSLTLDKSGNIGIGITPETAFHVYGVTTFQGAPTTRIYLKPDDGQSVFNRYFGYDIIYFGEMADTGDNIFRTQGGIYFGCQPADASQKGLIVGAAAEGTDRFMGVNMPGDATLAYTLDVNGNGHFVKSVKFDAPITNLTIYSSTNYNGVFTNSTIRNATITNSTYYGNGVGLTNVTASLPSGVASLAIGSLTLTNAVVSKTNSTIPTLVINVNNASVATATIDPSSNDHLIILRFTTGGNPAASSKWLTITLSQSATSTNSIVVLPQPSIDTNQIGVANGTINRFLPNSFSNSFELWTSATVPPSLSTFTYAFLIFRR